MYQIDTPDAATAAPVPNALGTEGHWSGGNPGTGQDATTIDVDWLEALQQNLIAFLTASGLAHSKTDYSRLWQASLASAAFTDTGAVNALVVALPTGLAFPPASLVSGTSIRIKVAVTNTGPATLSFNGIAAAIVRGSGAPLVGGEMQAGRFADLTTDGTEWQLMSSVAPIYYEDIFQASGNWTARAGVYQYEVDYWGPGGGGGGSEGAQSTGSGAGAGEYRWGLYNCTPGTVIPVTLGTPGVGGGSGANGTDATNSTFGDLITCVGGKAGLAGVNAIQPVAGLGGTDGSGGGFSWPGEGGGLGYVVVPADGYTAAGIGGASWDYSAPGPNTGQGALSGNGGAFPGVGGNSGINGGPGGNGGPSLCVVRSWAR